MATSTGTLATHFCGEIDQIEGKGFKTRGIRLRLLNLRQSLWQPQKCTACISFHKRTGWSAVRGSVSWRPPASVPSGYNTAFAWGSAIAERGGDIKRDHFFPVQVQGSSPSSLCLSSHMGLLTFSELQCSLILFLPNLPFLSYSFIGVRPVELSEGFWGLLLLQSSPLIFPCISNSVLTCANWRRQQMQGIPVLQFEAF